MRFRGKIIGNRARRGASTVETVFVIFIAAAISLGVIIMYNQSTFVKRARSVGQQVQFALTATRTLYAGRSDFGANDTNLVPVLSGGRLLPADMIGVGQTLVHSFGGILGVRTAAPAEYSFFSSISMPASSVLVVQAANLPRDACGTLVSQTARMSDAGASSPVMILAADNMTINAWRYMSAPITMTAADVWCNMGNDGSSLVLSWYFRY